MGFGYLWYCLLSVGTRRHLIKVIEALGIRHVEQQARHDLKGMNTNIQSPFSLSIYPSPYLCIPLIDSFTVTINFPRYVTREILLQETGHWSRTLRNRRPFTEIRSFEPRKREQQPCGLWIGGFDSEDWEVGRLKSSYCHLRRFLLSTLPLKSSFKRSEVPKVPQAPSVPTYLPYLYSTGLNYYLNPLPNWPTDWPNISTLFN